jgi:hypothetical protein
MALPLVELQMDVVLSFAALIQVSTRATPINRPQANLATPVSPHLPGNLADPDEAPQIRLCQRVSERSHVRSPQAP